MNIAIIGTGYVGLVSGTCFAETGNDVVCVDINEEKIRQIHNGIVPIYEPGLEVLLERNIKQGRLTFTTHLKQAVQQSEFVFLALPTPPGEDGSADLSYVLGVADELGNLIERYTIVIDKSTVPVGTAEKVRAILSKKLDADLFDVVSNPEFLREGVAVDDFMKPDRIVIGVDSERAQDKMCRLYEPFVRQGNPILCMDIRSAEMTKYAANAYLATRISFMNEVANLCTQLGADIDQVRKGIGSDTRIGKRFLFAGVGYGGSCFPKDVKALVKTAEDSTYDFKILKSVMNVNKIQKRKVAQMIERFYGDDLKRKTIALWGLAFKPNTDDIREAPALETIDSLLQLGARIRAYDPEAMANIQAVYGDRIMLCQNKYEAITGADCLAILTEWNVFRTPDFDTLGKELNDKAIFDGRNLYSVERMSELGFYYESIGRKTAINNK